MPLTRREFLKLGTGLSLALFLPEGISRIRARSSLTSRQAIFVIRRGRDDLPHVCLTYDDMWDENYSLQIAEAFAERGVKVTFFPAGLAIRANIDRPTDGHANLYPRIYDMGHEFGCHTYSHIDISELDTQQLIEQQILPWINVLNEALGFEYQPVALRPPMAVVTDALFSAAISTDLPVVLWSTDMRDSFCQLDRCEEELLARFTMQIKNGEIFLQHTNAASLLILERQLAVLDENALMPRPLSTLLAALNGELEPETTPEPEPETTAQPRRSLRWE